MGKQRSLNPADVERRKEAERRKKINAETRRKNRDEALKRKTEDDLKEEITKIERMGQKESGEGGKGQRRRRPWGGSSSGSSKPSAAVESGQLTPLWLLLPLW